MKIKVRAPSLLVAEAFSEFCISCVYVSMRFSWVLFTHSIPEPSPPPPPHHHGKLFLLNTFSNTGCWYCSQLSFSALLDRSRVVGIAVSSRLVPYWTGRGQGKTSFDLRCNLLHSGGYLPELTVSVGRWLKRDSSGRLSFSRSVSCYGSHMG